MSRRMLRAALALLAALSTTAASAWGPDGHHTVGALADRLIAGTNAEAQVKSLLGGLTLEQAAVWADCAKGVDPTKNYAYTSTGKYPECAIYETPDGEAAMIDYVKRNDTNCGRAATDPSCHTQYHYTDEAIQRQRYRLGDVGTNNFDVVAAISATIHVLKGDPAPAPFDIKDKREALLLLSHFAGDITQPLHVGAVYLDPTGKIIDPAAGTYDPATGTQGGNLVQTIRVATNHTSELLHATWDDTPAVLHADHIDAAWLAKARAEPKTRGDIYGWSADWASTTMTQARLAFKGLQFGPFQGKDWTVPITGRYDDSMAPIKKRQLTAGGARLAQTLMAVWP
ncbi:S1/P1 nuclease [Scleromatobacter humisilvae]|uniref:S1/P1 nuclease n=1 Tax=Scleromatobacter humisilvae TaxID=2897159 RepID=A0A9X1YK42_9BURK|nr:S1/P1 nuclease [Scleromatobacter humisilvae]MCK9687177.1 S1/P1 nuclease [Scleromatobacter humisilvae]